MANGCSDKAWGRLVYEYITMFMKALHVWEFSMAQVPIGTHVHTHIRVVKRRAICCVAAAEQQQPHRGTDPVRISQHVTARFVFAKLHTIVVVANANALISLEMLWEHCRYTTLSGDSSCGG